MDQGERSRRHFDVVAEQMKQDIALIAEGQKALLEAESMNRTRRY
jgi:hypothetical protein